MPDLLYVQRDQPQGVPPLSLTGERTLPDVPEENYWFRRHLAVYEWIGARAHGRRVVDLACGEGYGSAVLARTAASVVGVDANPEAFEHARLKYTGDRVRFERNMLELWTGDVDCVVFLQTIEHVQDPDAVLEHVRELIGPGGVAYVSTPNVLTLAPKGAERSGNPWHVREYRAAEYRALCERHFGSVDLLGLFHARRLRAHQWAIEQAGWDAAARAGCGLTRPFYERLVPAISTRDFRAPPRAARPRARLPRGAAPMNRLSIVLHTHMPYVEGFGTWPFGEEWLWEAIATSYRAAAGRARRASRARDALAHAGAVRPARGARALERCLAFLREIRRSRTGWTSTLPTTRWRLCWSAARRRTRRPADALAARGDLVAAFAPHVGWTSAATHPVLPLLATSTGVRLQLRAGIAAHRERFGEWDGGLWLPECAHAPWLDDPARGGERADRLRRLDRRARPGRARAAARRVGRGARADRP
jgi:SAM-dependent methyltransferase